MKIGHTSSVAEARQGRLNQTLYHGASPGRWSRSGSTPEYPRFAAGCFLTSDPGVAALYCADWTARDDRLEYIQQLIEFEFADGDEEELEANDFIEMTSNGFRRTKTANADYLMKNWGTQLISHLLVGPNHWRQMYPSGAVIFPMRLNTTRVTLLDCGGANWDAIPGAAINEANGGNLTTDEIVQKFAGKTDAVWFMNLTDLAHINGDKCADTVFVYSLQHVEFALTKG